MPCDYKKYAPNWKTEIRPRILARAGDKCEKCGRPNGEFVYVWSNGYWATFDGDLFTDAGKPHYSGDEPEDEPRFVKTVLTIAHFDHDVTNNADSNLFAWCQRCHLVHDAPHHAVNAKATRDRKKAEKAVVLGGLFG